MTQLERLFADPPSIHRAETEIKRKFSPEESYLPPRAASALAFGPKTCYAISFDVCRFIQDSVAPGSKTLEIGAGMSTLAFALQGTTHFAVTPNEDEVLVIREYARSRSIDLGTTTFVVQESERYLPNCDLGDFDVILIDGKHAFPWPIIDWFYTADRLKNGGYMIIDDVGLNSVSILVEFLNSDPRWQLKKNFSDKTIVFKKLVENVHDVAWHMQPYALRIRRKEQGRSLGGLLKNLLRLRG
jgi:hypothetical protein